MNLMRFLIRSSRGIVILSAIAGAAGGVAGIALIALIQEELAREPSGSSAMVWAFGALCVVSASARVIGQIGMVKLGQRAVAELSLHMVRRTLDLSLREFERIDTSALLAALTEDIVLIANAMVGIPQLCINIPIVIACLAYIGWLSPVIFVCGVIFAALAIAAYLGLSARAIKELREARACQDVLVGHFRTLIDGFRELKLHRGRRDGLPRRVARAHHGLGPRPDGPRPEQLRVRRRLEPARVLRLHRSPALRHPSSRADQSADARRGRPGRPLPDEPAGHHPDLGSDPGPGAGVAQQGPGPDPRRSNDAETKPTTGDFRQGGSRFAIRSAWRVSRSPIATGMMTQASRWAPSI